MSRADTVKNKNQVQVCCKDADFITPYGRVGKFDTADGQDEQIGFVPRRSTHVEGN